MTSDSETTPSAPHDSAGSAGNDDFNLVRYFSLTCLGVFVLLTSVMCTGFYYITKRYIRIDAEHHAVPIAERLAPIAFTAGSQLPEPGTPEYSRLDEQLRDALRPLGIFKIKVYDLDRRIIYTTDSRIQVGRLDANNSKLERALEGGIVSVLQTEDSVWDLDEEERIPGAIVETYVPVLRSPSDDVVRYVFEIYQDVSATYSRLPGLIALIVGASVVAMGVLYGILYLVVRMANQIIREQTQTIKRAKLDLETHAQELERRVVERTRQLHESLAQQQQDEKMVAMGTLASGVAHELNTPLGTILASTQMVLDHCSFVTQPAPAGDQAAQNHARCDPCLEDLKRVESQAKRCKDIIQNLVGFSRKSDGQRSWEDLGGVVDRSLSLVALDARESNVQVQIYHDRGLPPVFINENEIQQVLVNVMSNGIAAMPDGGTLGIRMTRRKHAARIEVSDTGVGIDSSELLRIFEPFFTTKEPGKGTGLGLSISYRIVKDHGGHIYVSSIPGENTTFSIELPFEPVETDVPETEKPQPAFRSNSSYTDKADP